MSFWISPFLPRLAQESLVPRCRPTRSTCQSVAAGILSQFIFCVHIIQKSILCNVIWHDLTSIIMFVSVTSKDCANQIFWWRKFSQQCKSHNVKKGIYLNPQTAEHLSGLVPHGFWKLLFQPSSITHLRSEACLLDGHHRFEAVCKTSWRCCIHGAKPRRHEHIHWIYWKTAYCNRDQ